MYKPIKQAIDTSGFVAVSLPTGHGCAAYSLWTEDGKKYEVSDVSDGTGSIVVTSDGTAGMALSIEEVRGKGAVICYAKGSSNTNLVGIITKQ
jgi:hypothetical protein